MVIGAETDGMLEIVIFVKILIMARSVMSICSTTSNYFLGVIFSIYKYIVHRVVLIHLICIYREDIQDFKKRNPCALGLDILMEGVVETMNS